MFLDGHRMGLFQATHHVGFLLFCCITGKNHELVEHDAVLKQLRDLHAKSFVLGSIQSRPEVLGVELHNNMVPLNLGPLH